MSSPGFFSGVALLGQALAELKRSPRLWSIALIPAGVFLGLWGVGLWGAEAWLFPRVHATLGWLDGQSWLSRFSGSVLSALLWLLTALFAAWLGLLLTPSLSAPALEHLVTHQERRMGVPERPRLSFFTEMRCGLRAQATAFACTVPLLMLLWLFDLLFPPVGIVLLPLKVLLMATALAWNLLDYPLTLRGVPARERLGLLLAHPRPILGFGLTFGALFWLPGASVFLLPLGALASTRLVWLLMQADPTLLPEIERKIGSMTEQNH